MKDDKFVAEGKVEVGPRDKFFLFLDGEHLGELIVDHFRLPGVDQRYCELGKARITVELLQEAPTDQR